jgi:GTPase SAR1 family protein
MGVISLEQNCIPGRILYWIVYFAGKSTYVKQMWTGEFEGKYEPTMGKHERMLEIPTKQGSTRFLCIDTAGHEKPGILRDQY